MRDIGGVARSSQDDQSFDGQRSNADVIAEFDISNRALPDLLSILRIEAKEMRTRSAEVNAIIIKCLASLPDIISLRIAAKFPNLLSCFRVHCPHVVGHGKVQNSFDLKR